MPKTNDNKWRLMVWIDPKLRPKLKRRAKQFDRSMSWWVSHLIKEDLEKAEREE